MTVLAPVLEDRDVGDDWDIVHFYCECDRDLGLCGLDISDMWEKGYVADDEVVCVVCEELRDLTCPRCGDST